MADFSYIKCFLGVLFFFIFSEILAQDDINPEKKGYNYEKAWSGGIKLRTDGWGITGEYDQIRNYKRSLVYQIDLGEYKHPKMKRQSLDPNAGIFGGGFKPFVFGKINSLYALHLAAGQRHLLAEQARKNGVLINFQYLGGFTLGILKPYFIEVFDDPTGFETVSISYDKKDPDPRFLNVFDIAGGSGFGTGWKLKFRPGLHFKTGLQFDWSAQDDFIKAVEVGFSYDEYFTDVPLMLLVDNKARFFSLYLGISLGKKK